jgi:hypothetical protein
MQLTHPVKKNFGKGGNSERKRRAESREQRAESRKQKAESGKRKTAGKKLRRGSASVSMRAHELPRNLLLTSDF